MKNLFNDERTAEGLREWAAGNIIHTASFYFWNQGSELQKTGLGLFQSLLYQILRSAPDFIQNVCRDRLHHEPWTMEEFYDTLERLAKRDGIPARFCSFVDALDEYKGAEKDIVCVLGALCGSVYVKMCVSSRPGRQYESYVSREERGFVIAKFTRVDMQNHVDIRLQESPNWRKLMASDPSGSEIVSDISTRAGGVWLWVSLVTDETVKEVEKNEEMDTLRNIVTEFPDDLYRYFERMIKKTPAQHREEMAQTLLVVVSARKPLPLYAFRFL